MSYTLRPNPSGDTLAASRDPIRTNFQILQDRFKENHVDLDGLVGGGKHKFLQLPDQGAAPATAASESGFYSALASGESNLFFRGELNGKEYQLTTANQAQQATFGTANGWTFLPGGLIMQYGNFPISPNIVSGTITFPFSFSTAVYNIQMNVIVTGAATGISASSRAVLLDKFDFRLSGIVNSIGIYWMAIGK